MNERGATMQTPHAAMKAAARSHQLRRIVTFPFSARTREPPAPFPSKQLLPTHISRDRAALASGNGVCPTHSGRFIGSSRGVLPTPLRITRSRSASAVSGTDSGRMQLTYLGQADAQRVDEELMGPDLGFSIEQLMELAGLSVASAVQEVYQQRSCDDADANRVLIVCGPGNNGGDGLVAARHLHHFGFNVEICYPKPTDKPLFNGLVKQCKNLGIPFLTEEEIAGPGASPLSDRFQIVMDAIFGFSFRGAPRPPFDRILTKLIGLQDSLPIVSVDIPSGWDVEKGDESGQGLKPDMLVSLTTPKRCAQGFQGKHHYLGGRFVPPAIINKFNLHLPPYKGASQCVRIE